MKTVPYWCQQRRGNVLLMEPRILFPDSPWPNTTWLTKPGRTTGWDAKAAGSLQTAATSLRLSILLLRRMWYSCLTTNASLSLFCYWNCLLYKLEMFASKTIFKRIRFSEQKWLNETRKYLRGKKHETASDNVWLQSIKESFHVFTKRKRKEKSFYPLKKYTDKKFRIHLHFGMLPNTELFLLPWFLLNIPFLFASLKQWHLTVCISIFGWGKKSVLVLLGSNYHSWIMFLFFKSNKCL